MEQLFAVDITARQDLPSAVSAPTHLEEGDDAFSQAIIADRRLWRVLQVATITTHRFAVEKIAEDPLQWMMTPKRLFSGRRPAEACCEADEYARAILFHGLSIGIDADPNDLDRLLESYR